MSIQDLAKDVLEQLKCPVCKEYMLPPIMLCGNGHNICSSCKEKFPKCPTCRESLSNTQNKALENLALRVEFPCHNKPHGCTLTFPIALIREHQDVCEYNPLVSPIHCPLRNRDHCNWKGAFQEVKHHVIQKHKLWVTNTSGIKFFCIKNFNKSKIYLHILLLNDDMFY
jgi:E3 ubiquitin-protein ligase SIAH1